MKQHTQKLEQEWEEFIKLIFVNGFYYTISYVNSPM